MESKGKRIGGRSPIATFRKGRLIKRDTPEYIHPLEEGDLKVTGSHRQIMTPLKPKMAMRYYKIYRDVKKKN